MTKGKLMINKVQEIKANWIQQKDGHVDFSKKLEAAIEAADVIIAELTKLEESMKLAAAELDTAADLQFKE